MEHCYQNNQKQATWRKQTMGGVGEKKETIINVLKEIRENIE